MESRIDIHKGEPQDYYLVYRKNMVMDGAFVIERFLTLEEVRKMFSNEETIEIQSVLEFKGNKFVREVDSSEYILQKPHHQSRFYLIRSQKDVANEEIDKLWKNNDILLWEVKKETDFFRMVDIYRLHERK